MNGRVFVSIANLFAIIIAFVILFEFPQYATYAFYLLITWMVVAFVLLYALRPTVSAGRRDASSEVSPFPSSPAPANVPLRSAPEPAPSVGFCIYCATPIPPGTRVCPACGHALPGW